MKKSFTWYINLLLVFSGTGLTSFAQSSHNSYYLIAHRGGVVDSNRAENSLPAIKAAIEHGYKMVEIDLRLTKDSVLIIHHDMNFKRYFGVDKPVAEMTWGEISTLQSNTGSRVLQFEEALQYCSGKIDVMIDNKIKGNDTALFGNVVALLKKYGLQKGALMIGTEESTDFFTGRIKLSCTRKQLEENMLKPGYSPSHYYLFGNELSRDDV
ncbi:MAG TPA: glycerophosphodiester phosphodiesterase family protein, partial [Agriterribacter sp.]|nr:glycerophosphodiester phosphodiesterase family protein [Agriterribacter sp.]